MPTTILTPIFRKRQIEVERGGEGTTDTCSGSNTRIKKYKSGTDSLLVSGLKAQWLQQISVSNILPDYISPQIMPTWGRKFVEVTGWHCPIGIQSELYPVQCLPSNKRLLKYSMLEVSLPCHKHCRASLFTKRTQVTKTTCSNAYGLQT